MRRMAGLSQLGMGIVLIASVWPLRADTGPISPAAVDALYSRAANALNADSIRVMAKALGQGVSGYPNPAELLTRIGLLYLRVADADSARSAFRRATRQDPGQAAAHCGLGRVHLELEEDAKGALPYLRAALNADSTYAAAHYFLARVYQKMGRPEARREADRAIRYDPKYAPAYLLLAQLHRKEDSLPMAILYYRKYLEQDPKEQAPAYEFALDLLSKGHFKEVEEITSLMVDRRGLPLLAQMLMHRGDSDGAMRAFEIYIENLDPKERELYLDVSLVGRPQEVEAYKATPPEKRDAFLRSFWLRHDPFKASGGAVRRVEHCRRVWYARTFCGQRKWPWDRRGEVYIRYGEPDYRSSSRQPNLNVPLKVQRVQDDMAYQLYGASGLGITFVGPVFPIRADAGHYRNPPSASAPEEPGEAASGPLPEGPISDPGFGSGPLPQAPPEIFPETGVKVDPEFAVGLNRWKPVTMGNNWTARPWEVWVYADVGKGMEVAFTDEFNSGVYDYAPLPGMDAEDLKRLDEDRYQGETAYVRLVQRLTELSPSTRMAKVSQEMPERFDLSPFEPLDFSYDVVSFRGPDGLTDLQVNIGIPVDQVALPGEADTTVVVDRRVALINSQYTGLLPAHKDLEVPVSGRTRGQGVLDRVDLRAAPGDYDLAVQAGRRNTNRLQSYRQRLSIPNYGGTALALSDLFIAGQVTGDRDTTGAAFVRDRWRITPLPSHVFRVGQHVYVYFETYNLTQNASGLTHYEVSHQVRTTGAAGAVKIPSLTGVRDRSGEAVSVRYERTGTQESVSDYIELDLGQAGPGPYAVRMTVKDLNSGREVTKEGAFWIVDQPR